MRAGFAATAVFAAFTFPEATLTCLLEADVFALFPAAGTAIRFCFAPFFIEKKTSAICFPALSCYIDSRNRF